MPILAPRRGNGGKLLTGDKIPYLPGGSFALELPAHLQADGPALSAGAVAVDELEGLRAGGTGRGNRLIHPGHRLGGGRAACLQVDASHLEA